MRKLAALLLTTVFIASAPYSTVLADDWRHHGDIHSFHDHDYDHWRGGNWFHGLHDGRNGWWWIVDGLWYFYPTPVYPYPDPYTPPVIAVAPAPVSPYGVAPTYVYYCNRPAGYYPYVAACAGHWHRVLSSSTPSTVIVTNPSASPSTVIMSTQAPSTVSPIPPQPPGIPGDQHGVDDHVLESLSAELKKIDLNSPQAAIHLQTLEKRVEDFRQSLFQRNYNAMDLLKNAEKLKNSIMRKRLQISKTGTDAPSLSKDISSAAHQ